MLATKIANHGEKRQTSYSRFIEDITCIGLYRGPMSFKKSAMEFGSTLVERN